jgi:hypothetical protein
MDDDRVREFETALWVGGEDVYRRSIDPDCLMVVPSAPFLMSGSEAIEAVSRTPRWDSVEFDGFRIGRPQEGLIVLAYGVRASRSDQSYAAYCTSTYRRIAHEQWRVVQHQQSVVPVQALQSEGTSQQDGSRPGVSEQAQKDAAQSRETEHGYQ